MSFQHGRVPQEDSFAYLAPALFLGSLRVSVYQWLIARLYVSPDPPTQKVIVSKVFPSNLSSRVPDTEILALIKISAKNISLLLSLCQLAEGDSRFTDEFMVIHNARLSPRQRNLECSDGGAGDRHLLPRCRGVACFAAEGVFADEMIVGFMILDEEFHEGSPDRAPLLILVFADSDSD